MTTITREQGFHFTTNSKPGTSWAFTHKLAQDKLNLKTFFGNELDSQAEFFFVADDQDKAKSTLESNGLTDYEQQEALIYTTEDKCGSYQEFVKKIADAGINIERAYTTTYENKPSIVFWTDDNQKAYSLFT